MTYEPSNTLIDKVARTLRTYQHRRMLDFKLDVPIISVSFDDFPKTAISEGARALEARNLRGTYYTCASFAGTTNHHGPQYDQSDIPALEASGHEIGGHTFSHVDCVNLDSHEVVSEVDKNQAALLAMGLKSSPTGFAYPYGSVNKDLKPVLGQKFKASRGIRSGAHYDKADLNELKSIGLYAQTFNTVMAQIASLKARPGWLTLFTHDIQDSPTAWGCTPKQFETVLDAALQIGCVILPVRDAVDYLETQHA